MVFSEQALFRSERGAVPLLLIHGRGSDERRNDINMSRGDHSGHS